MLLPLAIAACVSQPPAHTATPTLVPVIIPTPTPLKETLSAIVDADMGEDDIRALLYLLKHPNVQVKAITVAGAGEAHCEPGVRHALGLLALIRAGNIPVACGRSAPLAGDHAFPSFWRRGADNLYGLTLPEGGSASALSAPEMIASIVRGSPEKVLILATGPLTNVAEALAANPDMAEQIRMIYVMGGAVKVPGNVGFSGAGVDNAVAEWNIYIDPHAAGVVFDSGAPITLVPLDATRDAPVTMRFYQMLAGHRGTAEAAFVYDLLTANLGMVQGGGAQFWDSLTAAILTDESLAAFETQEIQVVEEEGPECGWTKPTPGGAEVRVAVSADGQSFEKTLVGVLNLP